MVVVQKDLPCGAEACGLAQPEEQSELMQAIDETTRVLRNDTLATGEVDGEMVALDINRGQCFGMDSVGSELWALAGEPIAVGEIADSLAGRYDVGRDECLADILPFVSELIEEGLLSRLAG
jgi:hypothetical protein